MEHKHATRITKGGNLLFKSLGCPKTILYNLSYLKELQERGDIQDNSKIIFLISQ